MLKKLLKKILPSGFRQKMKESVLKRFEVINVTRPYNININKKGRFNGQVVVVTGGSGAIGRAICFRFASEGAKVYVCGRTESKLSAVINEIREAGGSAFPGIIDISNKDSIQHFFDTVIAESGKIDVLVTSAGGSAREKNNNIADQDPDIIKDVIDVNLIGTILCTKYAAKQMMTQNSGKIVTISSSIGTQGKAGYSEYAASKGAVIVFTKSLAMELGKYGINVNCVSPGIVQRDAINFSKLERIKQTNYMNDYGKPEDIANMVAFAASDEASFITGQNFIVDGGRSLGLKGD
ncbi:MAG: SDR family oxidoreductase [Paludibacter sp.]|nr:SDR family oxidoreductase [Paludibacter sp.]